MYNFYLAIKDTTTKRSIPVLWTSAKTYYEENSSKSQHWSWADPWITFDYSIDEILELCRRDIPAVFGFSIYVWNESYMNELAQRVKQQHPQCVVVYGGPQVNVKYNEDFFNTHHWVDAVCPSDGYGEIVIKEILDNYPINNWNNIPYVWYTDSQRQRHFSTTPIEKKTFNWPSNIYQAQEKYFEPYIDQIDSVILETTRGCPYKCIYCDWGGGTYTKLVSKPYTTILDEIEWVAKNKIPFLGFPSANFGILPIDVDIAEHCVVMNKQYGYPKYIHSEPAKNNINRVGKIQEILLRGQLLNHVKVSIQTINDDIKNNIERIDPPIEKQVENIQRLRAINPDLPVKIETILGLPGDNYKTVLDQFDQLFRYELPMPRNHIWMLLPEAPAYDPAMREKFQLGTTNGTFISAPFSVKPGPQDLNEVKGNFFNTNSQVEMVVETYSYSRDEFVDMYMISSLALALEYLGIRDTLIFYLQQHNFKPSEFIDLVYSKFVKTPDQFNNKFLQDEFDKIYQAQYNCTHGLSADNLVDIAPDFPFMLSIPNHMGLIILQKVKEFLEPVCVDLAQKFNDEKIVDLGKYITHSVIDISYDPTTGRKFSCDYDWLDYFKNKSSLSKTSVTYKINDTEVYLNTRMQPIDWHLYQSDQLSFVKQYTIKQILEINSKVSKTIRQC